MKLKIKSAIEYMSTVFNGIEQNKEEILDLIKANLKKDWAIERISKVNLAILEIAIYEIKYQELPFKVAINEAVELNETQIGVQYVVLCADTAAVGFYENKKLGFSKIRQMQDIPREHRNENCVPMMLKIAEN